MKRNRLIVKWLEKQIDLSGKVDRDYKWASVNVLLREMSADPQCVELAEVKSAKTLIREIVSITEERYPNAYAHLRQLEGFSDQQNLTIYKVIKATHAALGSVKEQYLNNEITVYEIKKSSKIWFTQLLITIARYEAFETIEKDASARTPRSDKNEKLRAEIKKALELATVQSVKLNKAALARVLKVSKQRVGKLAKELYPDK